MTTIVLDLETTIRNPVGNHSANPMWKGNKIIAAGWLELGGAVQTDYDVNGLNSEHVETLLVTLDKAVMVVGHNIKFDLLYMYRNTNRYLPTIWDTQLAEYLLTGQTHLYSSLDQLTAKYVGDHALKDDRIKEYWKQGIDTDKIPKAELISYLEGDVNNTAEIFKAQYKQAEEQGILPLMFTQMDALRATTEMNRNGMRVDWNYVESAKLHYDMILEQSKTKSTAIAPDVDVYSPKQLSLYFLVVLRNTRRRSMSVITRMVILNISLWIKNVRLLVNINRLRRLGRAVTTVLMTRL